ncbi:MAG: hypothetical protein IT320_24305 [Anaerolineae bacterium]|nr:hypothetical protein [Anaerolineae bacterium]
MDPTLFSLAHKLRAEMLAEAAQQREQRPEQRERLLHRLGGLLVTLGQKMQAKAVSAQQVYDDGGYSSLENEICVCIVD